MSTNNATTLLANTTEDTKPVTQPTLNGTAASAKPSAEATIAENQDPANTEEQWVTVPCPIKAFKGVTLEINILATTDQMNGLTNQLRNGEPQGIVRNVQGWDEQRHGKLFSNGAPMLFIVWITRNAFGDAMHEYLADPNLSTQ